MLRHISLSTYLSALPVVVLVTFLPPMIAFSVPVWIIGTVSFGTIFLLSIVGTLIISPRDRNNIF